MNERYGIELDLITAPLKQKMNDTKIKIAELTRTLNTLKTEMKYTDPGTQAFREYALAIEEAKQELNQLKNSQNMITKMKTRFKSLANSVDTGIGKIKRFALELLSVRSAYRIVSKAANAYLATNEELSNKMQSAWAGLGSMLAPILEWIANAMIKVVGYINVFIRALTGIDLLARATTKSIKSMGASAKSTSKALAGFDTITNLSDSSGGLAGGIENPFGAFNDANLNTKWINKFTKFGNWVNKNKKSVISGISGIAGAVAGIKLTTLLSNMGLIPKKWAIIKGLGIGIAIWGTADALQGVINYMKKPDWENFGLTMKGIGKIALGVGITFGSLPIAFAGALVAMIKTYIYDKFITPVENKFGEFGRVITEPIRNAMYTIEYYFDNALNNARRIFDGIISIFKGDFKNGFIQVARGIANQFINIINLAINAINGVLTPARALIVALGKVTGKKWSMSNIKIPTIPYLNVGTNYVPEDTLAMIHKGEAVVPKKFNSKEYFNGNNDETNRLLNTLIVTLENKDMNAYISSNDVGRASVSYINEQSRIMGRKLI